MPSAGKRILNSARKARAYARGGRMEGSVARVPEDVDVRAIRAGLGLSQEAFALGFGFSSAAVRDREQGRRRQEASQRTSAARPASSVANCPLIPSGKTATSQRCLLKSTPTTRANCAVLGSLPWLCGVRTPDNCSGSPGKALRGLAGPRSLDQGGTGLQSAPSGRAHIHLHGAPIIPHLEDTTVSPRNRSRPGMARCRKLAGFSPADAGSRSRKC
jgi:putative transcriptional regulator